MKFENTREFSPDEEGEVEVIVHLRLQPTVTEKTAKVEDLLREVVETLDGSELFVGLGIMGEEEVQYWIEARSAETNPSLDKQIKHIEEHSQAFEDHVGQKQSVTGYFADYGHIPDLYERLCSDLGIEPRYT